MYIIGLGGKLQSYKFFGVYSIFFLYIYTDIYIYIYIYMYFFFFSKYRKKVVFFVTLHIKD